MGAAITPSSRVRLAADVELSSLDDAEVRYAGAAEAVNPWVQGAVFHLGAEYQALPWLALRGGYHEDARAFAPAGAALLDEPARADVFATGLGLAFGGLGLDLTYEFSNLRYDDLWLSNGNENDINTHTVMFEGGLHAPGTQPMTQLFRPALLLALLATAASAQTDRFVTNSSELSSAISVSQPGDTVTMANGTWSNVRIEFDRDGVPGDSIRLQAETPGQVILNGSSTLSIGGDYLVVDGLRFRGRVDPGKRRDRVPEEQLAGGQPQPPDQLHHR